MPYASGTEISSPIQTPITIIKPIVFIQICLIIRGARFVPYITLGFAIIENDIMEWRIFLGTTMCRGPFPDNFISKIDGMEYGIKHHLEIMASGGITMEIERASGLQDTMEFYQANRHHGQIGHHIVVSEE